MGSTKVSRVSSGVNTEGRHQLVEWPFLANLSLLF